MPFPDESRLPFFNLNLHQSNGTVAALSLCVKDEVTGLVVGKAHTVELLPKDRHRPGGKNLHLARKVKGAEGSISRDQRQLKDNAFLKRFSRGIVVESLHATKKVVELAVFLDVAAYER